MIKSPLIYLGTFMNDNQKRLRLRVFQAADGAFEKHNYASPLDMFLGMELLNLARIEDWRKGRIPYLERVIPGSLNKITFCMKCFHEWAKEKGLKPSYTAYVRKRR